MAVSRSKQLLGLAVWLAISFIVAGIGSIASMRAATFYTQLIRPEWAPAPELFGPVWTLLYILMAIAAWLVWRVGGFRAACTALSLFLLQLVVNTLWSWLFFAWHLGAAAFVDVIVLWVLIVATLFAFWRIRPAAGVLLAPYLLWVTFAAALNYAIWQLNPQLLG